MNRRTKDTSATKSTSEPKDYENLLLGVVQLLEAGRRQAARVVHSVVTTSYWLVGKRIVEHEQKGQSRAEYGAELIDQLSGDLQKRLGRGFSRRNLEQMRQFYLAWPKAQTLSALFPNHLPSENPQTPSAELVGLAPAFPLSWSHYVRLLSVANVEARQYYEFEAIRGGWSVRQLDRQIATLTYERVGTQATESWRAGA